MKIVFLGAGNQGKTWLMKVASTGNVPATRSSRTSAAEENVKIYLLPDEEKLDASSQVAGGAAANNNNNKGGGANKTVVIHAWNIPGQNWRAYEANPSFFRLSEAAVVTVDCNVFGASDEELEEVLNSGLNPIGVAESMVKAARKYVPGIPIFLCLTKCDMLRGYKKNNTNINPADAKLKNDNAKNFQKAEKFIHDNNLFPTVICTSAQDNVGISKLFSSIYNEVQRKKDEAENGKGGDNSNANAARTKPVGLKTVHEEQKPQQSGCPCGGGNNNRDKS